jgi:methylmalonyl-CoA mutase
MPKLFGEFKTPSITDWKKLAATELKGTDIDQLHLWLESDGFEARPAYFRAETEKLPMYGQSIRPLRFDQLNNDWLICTDIRVETVEEANSELLHKLSLGAQAVTIDLNGHDFARDEFDGLFDGVVVDAIAISFTNPYNVLRFQSDYFAWTEKNGYPGEDLMGGFWFTDMNADLAAALINANTRHAFGAVGLDCQQFYMKGANIPQQLGASLAWGNEILNGLRAQGISFEQVADNLGFSLAIGSSFLPEVAKFRLMRFLWARVLQQHGASSKRWKTWVHAQTGERHLSSLDTPVNLLRENAQAMSAVFGGVDSLTINPFRQDEPELADRMAINTQHLMKEEAHLDRVIDPAAGSYYVEHLTDILGKKSWDFFLEIEERGGYSGCASDGFLEDAFSRSDEAYYAEVEKLERVLIGTNKYPSPFEKSNDKVEEDEA